MEFITAAPACLRYVEMADLFSFMLQRQHCLVGHKHLFKASNRVNTSVSASRGQVQMI